MKVLVIGAGKMVGAILKGLKGQEDLSGWSIYSPSGISAKKLAEEVGASFTTVVEGDPDWILLGCKPQQLSAFAEKLPETLKGKPFVSVLAALSEEQQRTILGVKTLTRVMPNLAVEIRSGVILLSSHTDSDIPKRELLFRKLGKTYLLKEKELEELTLLAGSGPAFFYELALNLAHSFTSLAPLEKEELARQVLIGAGLLSQANTSSLQEQINAVTSKGGVTIAVLEKWRELKMADLVKSGVQRGKERTEEIKALIPRK